jgi:hypothetical protein
MHILHTHMMIQMQRAREGRASIERTALHRSCVSGATPRCCWKEEEEGEEEEEEEEEGGEPAPGFETQYLIPGTDTAKNAPEPG